MHKKIQRVPLVVNDVISTFIMETTIDIVSWEWTTYFVWKNSWWRHQGVKQAPIVFNEIKKVKTSCLLYRTSASNHKENS